jgi:hypothetical protein
VGSWPNHFLSDVLGAKSFRHSTIRARFFVIPRGQTRSTRILIPSLGLASLYARLMRTISSSHDDPASSPSSVYSVHLMPIESKIEWHPTHIDFIHSFLALRVKI